MRVAARPYRRLMAGVSLRLLRQLEGVGVLEEGAAGARGQRRYVARAMMAAVAGEGLAA